MNKPERGHSFTQKYAYKSRSLKNTVVVESALAPTRKIEITALWDTGASLSCIRPEIVKELNLSAVSMISISTPTDEHKESSVYLVNLHLPSSVSVMNIRVAEGVMRGCDMLIGMDVISLGDFVVSNYQGKTAFSFRVPSMAEFDFQKHSYSIP
ncbi:MAG: hypothetical protein Ta2A_03500 [Treponemataceae bacterium]|nr:MAG: hypothetical protein Ta2A_03500 [Treponemataceae bacterium]